MHGTQRRSHKHKTYGRSSRTQRSTYASFEESKFHAKSHDRQGISDTSPTSESPDLQQQRKTETRETRETEVQKTRPSGKPGGDLSGNPSFPDESTYRFRSSIKDEPGSIKRKRYRFSPDFQGIDACEISVCNDGFSDVHAKSETTFTKPDNIKRLNQSEKWDGINAAPDFSLQSQPNTKSGYGEIIHPRKKLVDLLDSVHPPAEGPSASFISDRESNSVACTSQSTLTRQRDIMPQRVEDSATVPSSGLRGPPVTYARQRSFLNEVYVSSGIEDKDANTNSKNQQLETKKASCFDLDADDDTSVGSGPIRSIHELRQAGDNSRFRSAVDCMFEDIANGDNTNSTRCNGFVQLSSKLLDHQFINRFSECGFAERLVEYMKYVKDDLDMISASFALCSIELLFSSGAFPQTHLASLWQSLLDLSPRLIDVEDDILLMSKARGSGVSKAVQKSIQETLLMLSNRLLPRLSPRSLALQCIRSVLSNLQQHNNTIEAMPTAILDRFVCLLISIHHSNMDSPLSPEDCPMVITILSILETYTLLLGPLPVDQQSALKSLTQLFYFLQPKGFDDSNDRTQQIHVHYIRLILNLTNNEPSFCNAFVTPGLVQGLVSIITSGFNMSPEGGPVEESNTLNRIILALGTLINLAEKSDMAKAMFLIAEDHSTSFLHSLVQKFSANINLITETHPVYDSHYNVVVGYLSILLVTLCLNLEALSQVKELLGGEGLDILLSTADEFQQYHEKVEEDLQAGGSAYSSFTAQLQSIICQVRQSERSL